MYRIRCFGNDAACDSVEDLQRVLSSEYAGQSVSVVYPSQKTGMKMTLFVDVGTDGALSESYGSGEAISLSERIALS